MHAEALSAEQARRNMQTAGDGPREAVDAINDAIQEASERHRGHTTVFLSRTNIDPDDLARIKKHFSSRGFKVDDRCHDRDTFAMQISWYPI